MALAGNGIGLGQSGRRSEHGAVLIHVALAMMALLSFTVVVVDYGVLWVGRRQAQNAADAGALAGAIALVKDGQNYATPSAQTYAASNVIWGEANSAANVDVTLSGPGASIPPCGTAPGCVRVDVYRNTPDRAGTTRGTSLPVFFGPMLGITQQGVRATATAETSAANVVRCLLPFAVADRWADAHDENVDTAWFANDGNHLQGDPIGGWSPNDIYQDAQGDYYNPPHSVGHTGWTLTGDFGRQLVLKDGEMNQFSAGWANTVNLPGSVGANDYRDDIRGCNLTHVGIALPGQTCTGYAPAGTTPEQALQGCLGVETGMMAGPTSQGVSGGGPPGTPSLYEQDPGARWDWSQTLGPGGLPGGVVDANGAPNMSSPRIRPLPVFDIAHYMASGCTGSPCVIRVANIIGFFVEGMCDEVRAAGRLDPGVNCGPRPQDRNEVVGRIVTLPATYQESAGSVTKDAAFLKVVRLVR